MELHLQHKIILVTGGASGIGESVCRRLAEEGAIPCMVDRDTGNLERVAAEIRRHPSGNCLPLSAELTDPAACRDTVAAVIDQFGRLDGLVNNAGVNDGVGLEFGSYESFLASLEKNVGHYFSMAHFALPWLKRSQGAIVNVCSKTALTGQGGTSGYAAANGERLELTGQWAKELSPYGIRVNGIVVAECATPQYEQWLSGQSGPSRKRLIESRIPLENRLTTPQEVADTVLFLLSSRSAQVNGEILFVDGGYVFLDRAIRGGE